MCELCKNKEKLGEICLDCHKQKIQEAKKEELKIIEGLIELHTNCHKYHKIDGNDATCLDIVLKHIKDELNHLSTFANGKSNIIADKSKSAKER